MRTITFTKGHGTKNDFVLLTDEYADHELSADTVRALADRHDGLGADGIIVATRSQYVSDAGDEVPDDSWFMDHRNSDGTVAEMCGNGARVFVHYLVTNQLVDESDLDGAGLVIGTRGGMKTVRRVESPQPADSATWYAIDMGTWHAVHPADFMTQGYDAMVVADRLAAPRRPGLSISMGNPHTVVALTDPDQVRQLNLAQAPVVDPPPAQGSNVEFIAVTANPGSVDGAGHMMMRVHERGVGETQSCGTGACASAVAARLWGGDDAPTIWDVDVPGGRLRIDLRVDEVSSSSVCGRSSLAGPAQLTLQGTVSVPR